MAIALLGGEAAAQTADFKCANPGTAVEYSNLRRTTWAGHEDDHCRLFVQGANILEGFLAWYAPTIELSGHQLETDHGGPLRLVVPHLYFWKSAKWLQAIEFLTEDKPGYWEVRGYHNRGDPWTEQRYSGD